MTKYWKKVLYIKDFFKGTIPVIILPANILKIKSTENAFDFQITRFGIQLHK